MLTNIKKNPPVSHREGLASDWREMPEATCSNIVLPVLLGDGIAYKLLGPPAAGAQVATSNTLKEKLG